MRLWASSFMYLSLRSLVCLMGMTVILIHMVVGRTGKLEVQILNNYVGSECLMFSNKVLVL